VGGGRDSFALLFLTAALSAQTTISDVHDDMQWEIALSSYATAPLRRYLRESLCVEHQAPRWSKSRKNVIHREA
jgi:hypothetical protein